MELEQLQRALAKWLPRPRDTGVAPPTPGAGPSDSAGTDSPVGSPVDSSVLMEMFGDDAATFREILTGFVSPATAIAEEVREAWAAGSVADVRGAAHKLKSSSRAIGANPLADLCEALEMAARSENLAEIDELAPRLPNLLEKVVDYITAL